MPAVYPVLDPALDSRITEHPFVGFFRIGAIQPADLLKIAVLENTQDQFLQRSGAACLIPQKSTEGPWNDNPIPVFPGDATGKRRLF
jgi:hypothetical protein